MVAAMAVAGEPAHADHDTFTFEAPRAPPAAAYAMSLVAISAAPLEPDADASIPLRDENGHALGPKLSEGQFCDLAASGSDVIDGATYQVIGTGRHAQANCRRYFSRLARKMPVAAGALGRSVFRRIDAPHGLGAGRFRLVPWRAVAATHLKAGRGLFIPALRGRPIHYATVHDGYVFVADRMGDAPRHQLSIVVDAIGPKVELPSGDVTVFAIDATGVVEALRREHVID